MSRARPLSSSALTDYVAITNNTESEKTGSRHLHPVLGKLYADEVRAADLTA